MSQSEDAIRCWQEANERWCSAGAIIHDSAWIATRIQQRYERLRETVGTIPFFDANDVLRQLCLGHDAAIERWMMMVAARNTLIRETEEKEPILSDMQYDVLDTLFSLKAYHPDTRASQKEIAKKLDLFQGQIKEPISKLVHLKLLESRTGRSGGMWLTKSGKEHVERQRKR